MLNPDIILFSSNSQVFKEVFCDYKLEKEISIGKCGFIKLYQANDKILIFGRNFNGTPFGAMKNADIVRVLKDYNF